MESNNKTIIIISAIILSLGFVGAGFNIGKGFRRMARTVTVKGLAEQDVRSDLGIFEINYRELGNDLVQLDQKILHDQQLATEFLKQQGFNDNEIYRSQLRIEDRLANTYNQTNESTTQPRYVVTGGIILRSKNVDVIDKTTQLTDKLLLQGVPLTFDASSLSPNPSYYFTQLDSIRPAMLATATKSAYSIANQFAEDSGVRLGGIQRASQGVFQIMGRDTSTMSSNWSSDQNALGSIDKKVRLVTTIDYRLK